MAEKTVLDNIAVNTIQEAILQIVSIWSGLPFKASNKTLQWNDLPTGQSIGLFTVSGGFYKSRYISGSYVGVFPFRIVYKCNPTNNTGRINAEKLVNELAEYLQGYSGKLSSDSHIEIQTFTQTSVAYKANTDEAGNEEYTCTLQVEYFYKK